MGGAQSTEATEPSHAHTVEEHNDPNCTRCFNRGYEFWLLAEAKKRNPSIKTYGLSWGVPGWVGNGTRGQGGYYSQANIDYHVRWVQGLKRVHNVSLDYMGIWNEHNYKASAAEHTPPLYTAKLHRKNCGASSFSRAAARATRGAVARHLTKMASRPQ